MTDQHDHDGPDAALRADIRRLGTLLGQTLARQEGRPLLDLVEEVRALVRTDAAGRRRSGSAGLDVATGTKLARAFSTYFHLANITEQVHRARDLRRRRAVQGGWLDQAAKLIAERGVPADGDRRRGPPAGGPAGLHRPPDRGGPPLDPVQAAGHRRRAGRRDRRRDPLRRQPTRARPTAGWPSCSTCCGRPTSCGSTGPTRPTRPATPSTTCATCTPRPPRRCSTTSPTRCARSAWRPPPTARPLTLRHLDRRRPRRQPVRHPGGHPRGAADPARARHRGHRGRRWTT